MSLIGPELSQTLGCKAATANHAADTLLHSLCKMLTVYESLVWRLWSCETFCYQHY